MASKAVTPLIRSTNPFSKAKLCLNGRPSTRTFGQGHVHLASLSTLPSRNNRRPQVWHSLRSRNVGAPCIPRRSIFIQTQTTPNADALKFLPNHQVLPTTFPSTFVEYTSPRSTLAPPHPSPLAARLLAVDGVSSIFYGSDFITVTKLSDANWAHIKPEVFSLITEAVTSGEQIVNTVEKSSGEDGQGASEDTLGASDDDSEVVSMIKELLETRIRPAIQEDGGDIEFRGFEDGMVLLKLRGACRTCDSSTVTLKNGIENMLMHYIEEVKGVNQVMDQEEEIAMKEFAKFEEKLRQAKGADAMSTSAVKDNPDRAEI